MKEKLNEVIIPNDFHYKTCDNISAIFSEQSGEAEALREVSSNLRNRADYKRNQSRKKKKN